MKKDTFSLLMMVALALITIGFLSYNVWLNWSRLVLPATPAPAPIVQQAPTPYDLGDNAQYLKIMSPLPGAKLASPLTITGEARGWYFEGSFPVELKDADGKTLATGQAVAQSDWMSPEFVPFKATLAFAAPMTATGTLIFKKDNPSGLPANDASSAVAVSFAGASVSAACRPSGCSGQVCSDQNIITDCLYLSEYACYKNAICTRQSDGKCGWTQTDELKVCLAGAGK